MPLKNSYITVTDQFCGAGGSSQGARKAGIEVKLALNHWEKAIATHAANFPNTDHDCTDISACDPRRYRSTDILITSPECTNHSLAKGQKQVQKQMDMFASGAVDASAERSRATMWDVPRFAEYHKYNIIIVENVVDARKWIMFDAWLMAMDALGYRNKCVYLNSMHCQPTPQSRDRMYVVFWKKGNKAPKLDYMPLAHCSSCGKDVNAIQTWKDKRKPFGKFGKSGQYVYCCPVHSTIVEPYYHAAFNIIDWSDKGQRIGDRSKPLSPNTTKRIEYGLNKYGTDPYIIHAAYSDKARGVVRSIGDAAFTQTSFQSQAVIQQPFIINDQQSTGVNCRVSGAGDKIPTVVGTPRLKVIMPFVLKAEHATQLNVKSAAENFQTQTTRQTMSVIVPPLMVENKGASLARDTDKALSCVTSVPYHGILTNEAWNSFISYYYSNIQTSHINDPLGTATTKERHLLVNYCKPNIDDCYYRMLKPQEIKLAMAFESDYIVTGSGKDQVKQLGNAVTPPAMEWLIKQCVESLQ